MGGIIVKMEMQKRKKKKKKSNERKGKETAEKSNRRRDLCLAIKGGGKEEKRDRFWNRSDGTDSGSSKRGRVGSGSVRELHEYAKRYGTITKNQNRGEKIKGN